MLSTKHRKAATAEFVRNSYLSLAQKKRLQNGLRIMAFEDHQLQFIEGQCQKGISEAQALFDDLIPSLLRPYKSHLNLADEIPQVVRKTSETLVARAKARDVYLTAEQSKQIIFSWIDEMNRGAKKI